MSSFSKTSGRSSAPSLRAVSMKRADCSAAVKRLACFFLGVFMLGSHISASRSLDRDINLAITGPIVDRSSIECEFEASFAFADLAWLENVKVPYGRKQNYFLLAGNEVIQVLSADTVRRPIGWHIWPDDIYAFARRPLSLKVLWAAFIYWNEPKDRIHLRLDTRSITSVLPVHEERDCSVICNSSHGGICTFEISNSSQSNPCPSSSYSFSSKFCGPSSGYRSNRCENDCDEQGKETELGPPYLRCRDVVEHFCGSGLPRQVTEIGFPLIAGFGTVGLIGLSGFLMVFGIAYGHRDFIWVSPGVLLGSFIFYWFIGGWLISSVSSTSCENHDKQQPSSHLSIFGSVSD